MKAELIGEIALDSLLDSLKVLGLAFVIYFTLSFFEGKIASLFERKKKAAPVLGAVTGVIPQCGISVVASDLFSDDHITLGTVIAIFIACSDEALPILFGDFTGHWYMAFALMGVKIVGGAIIGVVIDLLFRKKNKVVEHHLEECHEEHEIHKGCCGHEIHEHEEEKESFAHAHLLHPLIHSLKIFGYALLVSFLFGLFFEWLGTVTDLEAILSASYWFSPLIAILIGLIPNCASSVLLSELYISGAVPFGALIAGLAVNAGLGPLYLLKNKKTFKKALVIEGLLILSAIALGYAFMWVK